MTIEQQIIEKINFRYTKALLKKGFEIKFISEVLGLPSKKVKEIIQKK